MFSTPAMRLLPVVLAIWVSATSAQTLGGGTAAAGGKILSREELRACLARQSAIAAKKSTLDSAVVALNAERGALALQSSDLKSLAETVNSRNADLQTFNTSKAGYAERHAAFEAKRMELEAAQIKSPSWIARRRSELETERIALLQEYEASKLESDRLVARAKEAVGAFESQKGQVDAAVEAWNQRKAKTASELAAFELDTNEWRSACGSRRYREDDETAIKAGK